MKPTLLLIALTLASPFAAARISTVQELKYVTETLGPIAAASGFALIEDSISVHGYSAQEEMAGTFRWYNTPAGNQDHTIIFRVRKDNVEQWRTIFFMSKASRLGMECTLHNATSRKIVSAFDGRETCVTLYLKPWRKHMKKDPTMDNIRVPHPMLWDAFGSKKP